MTAFQAPGGATDRPRLSIVIPYHRSDPLPLLVRLRPLLEASGEHAEVVLLDDGGGDGDLNARVIVALRSVAARSRLLVQAKNAGRSGARNRLAESAGGEHLLLLDCDMSPERPDYLVRYLALAAADVEIAFGGFTVSPGPAPAPLALHHALQAQGECPPVSERRLRPARYVFSSNLLVRRSLLLHEPFDEAFTGWGWEDVEWGLRVADRARILQIDNPARHTGLDTAAGLLAKYEQSPANFARLAQHHAAAVRMFGSYHAARGLRALPHRRVWRPLLRALVLNPAAPLQARILAIKLYKAALYADVV